MREQEFELGTPRLLLTLRDAAKALAVSEKTLWSQTSPRGPIPSIRIGERSVRYSIVDLQEWIGKQSQSTESLSKFGENAPDAWRK